MIAVKPKSAFAAKKDGDWAALSAGLEACSSPAEVRDYLHDYALTRDRPNGWLEALTEQATAHVAELRADRLNDAMDDAFWRAMDRD